MKGRQVIRLLMLLLVLLGAGFGLVLLLPMPRTILVGFLRAEVFYKGMPVSYWREAILAWEKPGYRELTEPATTLDRLKETANTGTPKFVNVVPPLQEGDPNAIPILIELLKDRNPIVRGYAVHTLGMHAMYRGVEAAVPLLEELLSDQSEGNIPNLDIATQAAVTLEYIKANKGRRESGR